MTKIIYPVPRMSGINQCRGYNKVASAPGEDSDQPGHSPSLIRVFAGRLMSS